MKVSKDYFLEQLENRLVIIGFVKKGNAFFYEKEKELFLLYVQRSLYSNLYYIRGGFFKKPLQQKITA